MTEDRGQRAKRIMDEKGEGRGQKGYWDSGMLA
jgi:hypothetical protein